MDVNSKMTALADAIRAKANCSSKMGIDEMTNKVLSIPTGSSSLETATIWFFENEYTGGSNFTAHYIGLVDGVMTYLTSKDLLEPIYPVVGTYISIEGACGDWYDGGVVYSEDPCTAANGASAYKKFRVYSIGTDTIYLFDLPESGGSGVERLEGYLFFSSPNETTDVGITYGYYDESGNFLTQDLYYIYGNVVEIEKPVKGSLVILKGGAYGEIGWDGVEQVDSDGTVFRVTGQDSDNPVINILGKNSTESGPPEICGVGLLCSPGAHFFVEYITYDEPYEPDTYYTTAKRKYFDVASDMGEAFAVSDVVKGTLLKVVGASYCGIDYGDITVKYEGSIEIDADGNSASCFFVEINGTGDLLIS